MKFEKKDLISDYSLNKISNNANIISCYVGDIDKIFVTIKHNCVLICVGNDGSIFSEGMKKRHINPYANVTFKLDYFITKDFKIQENIKGIFAANVDVKYDRINILPRGIPNESLEYYKEGHKIIIDLNNLNIEKEKLLYINFNPITNIAERKTLYQKFTYDWCTTETNKTILEYLKTMKKHKFVLSPDGNGLDCHRTWEALYVGTIPIVQCHIFSEEFAKELPILVIDDWNILTEEFLEYKYNEIMNKDWNWDLLKLSYWKNKIEGCLI